MIKNDSQFPRTDIFCGPSFHLFGFFLGASAENDFLFQVDVNEKKMFGHSTGNSKSLGAPKFVSRCSLFQPKKVFFQPKKYLSFDTGNKLHKSE